MASISPLNFSKMHGAGNDFVVLDLRNSSAPQPELCRALADRHTGVGCDLILGVEAPRSADAVASYRIWTADGSSSQQCGNGARCIAAWALRAGIAQGTRFSLDSPSGTHRVDVLPEHTYRITMCVPQFAPKAIPLFSFEHEQDSYEVELDGGLRVSFAAVSMGNPHAVIEVKSVDSAPVNQVGQLLQNSHHLPYSINVGFAEIIARDRIRLRVYEYVAGETLACGSGACAAAAALILKGSIDRDVSVMMPGGELRVSWPDATSPITMAGPAAFIFEGSIDPSMLPKKAS